MPSLLLLDLWVFVSRVPLRLCMQARQRRSPLLTTMTTTRNRRCAFQLRRRCLRGRDIQ